MQRFVMSGRCGQLRKCVSTARLWGVACRHYAKRGGVLVTSELVQDREAARAGRGKPRAIYIYM